MARPPPASPGSTASSGFISEDRGAHYAGKAVVFPLSKRFLPVIAPDGSLDPKAVDENFRSTDEFLRSFGGAVPELYQLAKLLGAAYVTGAVNASTATDASGDVAFSHTLGRIPKMVFLPTDLNGTRGVITAFPAGLAGASGRNQTPWTANAIYVRASVSSDYAFFLL